ncbi:hypothetical protein niasHT_033742 [Heterodera trifolii]|uniref:BTB domain-containing protein n=1 Tax=Heterodera trifolii TaxID=157864 RepID=A0ABD2IH12_9BILA
MLSSSKPRNSMGRMKNLLSSGEDADVHFLVGEGEGKALVPAHKLILKSASDVFKAMFHFDSQQKGKAKNASADIPLIEVPDVEVGAFKVMLSFIYADDLSGLDGDNAMAVLYAAKKYGISELVVPCVQMPIPKLRNIFLAISRARLFGLEDFADQCLRYICQNAGQLFETEEFLQINQNLLYELLDFDQLVINNELEIWKALGPALFKIRFPLISTEHFSKIIVPSGVLTIEEFMGVYHFHCHPNSCGVPGGGIYPLKFPTQTRISDWNMPRGNNMGTLAMEIEKFSEFSHEKVGTDRESEAVVLIKGLPWKIWAEIRTQKGQRSNAEKCLALFLWCAASEKETNWSCKCSATFRIISQKSGAKDLTGKFSDRLFNNKASNCGLVGFTFAELMDPGRGLCDKNEDKLTVVVDVIVEEQEQKVDNKLNSDPNKSNGTILMEIDKLSEYSREISRSERISEAVQIKGLSWKIVTEIEIEEENNEKCLGFYLWCTAVPTATAEEGEDWSCKFSTNFRIVPQKSGAKDFSRKLTYNFVNNKPNDFGFTNFITFSELMDEDKGFYDKNEDKVTLAIDVAVNERKGTKRKLAIADQQRSPASGDVLRSVDGAQNAQSEHHYPSPLTPGGVHTPRRLSAHNSPNIPSYFPLPPKSASKNNNFLKLILLCLVSLCCSFWLRCSALALWLTAHTRSGARGAETAGAADGAETVGVADGAATAGAVDGVATDGAEVGDADKLKENGNDLEATATDFNGISDER